MHAGKSSELERGKQRSTKEAPRMKDSHFSTPYQLGFG
jgi:hypothetical protein